MIQSLIIVLGQSFLTWIGMWVLLDRRYKMLKHEHVHVGTKISGKKYMQFLEIDFDGLEVENESVVHNEEE